MKSRSTTEKIATDRNRRHHPTLRLLPMTDNLFPLVHDPKLSGLIPRFVQSMPKLPINAHMPKRDPRHLRELPSAPVPSRRPAVNLKIISSGRLAFRRHPIVMTTKV